MTEQIESMMDVSPMARKFRDETDVVERVVSMWNEMNGWIPGAAYIELAEALGVDPDRLVHYDNVNKRRHIPEEVDSDERTEG